MQDKDPSTGKQTPDKRNPLTSLLVAGIGVASALYMFNPTAGVFELIPDNIPVFGNLDEAGAAALLISSLAYFGLDLGRLFGKANKNSTHKSAPETSEEVIDV